MKPKNVNSVLLVGTKNTNLSSFLFQCAMYWAKQGCKVLYLSGIPFDKLPPSIHGTPTPGSDSFSNIRFMYLHRWQDFLKQMYSLHRYAHIPKVVIVEGIEHYCLSKEALPGEKYECQMHAGLVCASLLDAMSVCASYNSDGAVLVVSLEHCPSQPNKLDDFIGMFFSDLVWFLERVHSDDGNEGIVITNIASSPVDTRRKRIEFEFRKYDGALVLQKMFSFLNVC